MTVSFKTLGASLGILFSGAAIVAAVEAPANAQNLCHRETNSQGSINFCLTSFASVPGGFDTITLNGQMGGKVVRETMNIACVNGLTTDWNSKGTLTEAEADVTARGYCEGRGTTGM